MHSRSPRCIHLCGVLRSMHGGLLACSGFSGAFRPLAHSLACNRGNHSPRLASKLWASRFGSSSSSSCAPANCFLRLEYEKASSSNDTPCGSLTPRCFACDGRTSLVSIRFGEFRICSSAAVKLPDIDLGVQIACQLGLSYVYHAGGLLIYLLPYHALGVRWLVTKGSVCIVFQAPKTLWKLQNLNRPRNAHDSQLVAVTQEQQTSF